MGIQLHELTKICFDNLERILSSEKIKNDFHEYLEFHQDESIQVTVVDDTDNVGKVTLSKEDLITVLSIKIIREHKELIYIPLKILIGIGKIEFSIGSYQVEKCTAELLYNDELELIDADFYQFKINML